VRCEKATLGCAVSPLDFRSCVMCAGVISYCLLWAKYVRRFACQRGGHKGLTQLLTDGIVFHFHHFKEQTLAKNNNPTTTNDESSHVNTEELPSPSKDEIFHEKKSQNKVLHNRFKSESFRV
jgi:hypothetical protein